MRGLRGGKTGTRVGMTDGKTDIRTRYEYLIAVTVAVILCICAVVFYGITKYTKAARQEDPVVETTNGDGTVLIEVEISRETEASEETDETESQAADAEGQDETDNAVNEHDNITIFTVAPAGDNYYVGREGRLTLYYEPCVTGEERPSLQEGTSFEVLGFSRDGWAAIEFGGARYYVKSADIVKTEAPENALENYTEPENSQQIRFFTPSTGDDIEYVITLDTKGYNLPDVESTGNKIDLHRGERVIVAATSGEWYKIVYMNAEYYVLSYVEARAIWTEEHPEEAIEDNTGYAPAGSDEAKAAAEAGGADTSQGSSSGGSSDPSGDPSGDSSGGSGGSSGDSYSGSSTFVYELLTLTNEVREAAGLEPLSWSDTLAGCAAARAEELPQVSNEQNAGHLRPNGEPWFTVNGYTEDNSPMFAENIAYGQTSAREVFDAWMNSAGHYENIMRPEYRTFGAALYEADGGYYYYWVEEFGY